MIIAAALVIIYYMRAFSHLPATSCDDLAQARAIELLTLDPSFSDARGSIASLYGVERGLVSTASYNDWNGPYVAYEWQSDDTSYRANYVNRQLESVDTLLPKSRATLAFIEECLGEPDAYNYLSGIERKSATVTLLYPARAQLHRFSLHGRADVFDPSTTLQLFQVTSSLPNSAYFDSYDERWRGYVRPWPPR